jgi:hypothetical protein
LPAQAIRTTAASIPCLSHVKHFDLICLYFSLIERKNKDTENTEGQTQVACSAFGRAVRSVFIVRGKPHTSEIKCRSAEGKRR